MSLLAGFNWFFNPAWAVQKLFTLWGDGDGGSAGPSTTNVQNSNLPEYVQPYVMSMLGGAQNQMFNMDTSGNITGFKPYTPYSTNMNDYVAGFSPLQTQAQTGTAALTLPGQIGAGSTLAGAAGLGSMGAGANYAAQATSPTAMGNYMNPYLKNALDPQLAEIQRQYGITGAQEQGQATAAGAFGGSREALMAAENQRNKNMAMNQAIGTGYNTAFNNAQQSLQYGNTLGLQGMQAAGQAGATLGQLGQQQLTGQEGILAAQNAAGAQQQTQEQNKINQAIQNYAQQQQMPMQSLSNLSALLHGLPLQNTTTQSYQAAPSTISQIAGLGTGIAGISKLAAKEGGVMKSYAGGGITSLENRQRIAGNYTPQMINQEVQRGILPQGIGGVLSQDYTNMAGRAQQSQAAEQVAQRAAQAAAAVPDEATGVTGLPSNLPTQGMAQGGIIAFAEGKTVKDPDPALRKIDWSYAPEAPDYTEAESMITAAQAAPHTMDEIAAARKVEEGKRGIADVYTPMLGKLKEKEAALAGKRDQAQGLALLAASGKMLGSTSPYWGVGVGQGLGEYASNYGAASEKLDALKENYDQQNNSIALAQNAYKEAALTNDTNKMEKAKDRIIAAQENKQKIREAYLTKVDTGRLKGYEKLADYDREVGVQNLKNQHENAAKTAEINSKIYNATIQSMKQMYGEGQVNTWFQSDKAKFQDEFNRHLGNAKKFILGSETPDAASGTVGGVGGNTEPNPVESSNKFQLDGFTFPSQKALDDYKAAKGTQSK